MAGTHCVAIASGCPYERDEVMKASIVLHPRKSNNPKRTPALAGVAEIRENQVQAELASRALQDSGLAVQFGKRKHSVPMTISSETGTATFAAAVTVVLSLSMQHREND